MSIAKIYVYPEKEFVDSDVESIENDEEDTRKGVQNMTLWLNLAMLLVSADQRNQAI